MYSLCITFYYKKIHTLLLKMFLLRKISWKRGNLWYTKIKKQNINLYVKYHTNSIKQKWRYDWTIKSTHLLVVDYGWLEAKLMFSLVNMFYKYKIIPFFRDFSQVRVPLAKLCQIYSWVPTFPAPKAICRGAPFNICLQWMPSSQEAQGTAQSFTANSKALSVYF